MKTKPSKPAPTPKRNPTVLIKGNRVGLRSMLLEAHQKTLTSLTQMQQLLHEPEHYPVFVPDGARGKWNIRTRTLTEQDVMLRNFKAANEGFPEFTTCPGTYTILSYTTPDGSEEVMMSNTQFEYRTNVGFVQNARGHVLIAGLGLGMILRPLAANPNVKSITVIEKDPDVIALVAPHYADLEQLAIIQGDIFKHECIRTYDWALFDIWPTTTPDNLTEMHALRWRFRAHVSNSVCWAEDVCRKMAAQIKDLRQLKRSMQHAKQRRA